MGYVRKIITPDEKLLLVMRPHWIYLFEGILWFAVLTIAGLVIDYYFYLYVGSHAVRFDIDLWAVKFNELSTPIPWVFSFTGFAVFFPLFLAYISAEVGLTDQRIIYKRNLLFIEIVQVDLGDITAEHISHGWFGWLLGYGRLRLDCRFIDDVWLPAMRKPYRLIKAMHHAKAHHPGIDYTHDMLMSNLERIERERRENQTSEKIRKMKDGVIRGFRRVA